MARLSLHTVYCCCGFLIYYMVSKLLFEKVYSTSKMIIDEEFHLPQGLAYCNFSFDYWDPKITTLPGLYLVSGLILGPFNLCSVYWLRFINLAAAMINMILYYICFNLYNNQKPWINLLSTVNLSILPPLYFFSHVYYTDVLSLTCILLLIIAYKRNMHMMASIIGMGSVVMRQTNIIWVGMVFGQYVTYEYLQHSSVTKSKKFSELDISLRELKICMTHDFRNARIIKRLPLDFWLNSIGYLIVLFTFVGFVIINGGIVVGDKSAHTASLHIPQLFYFSVFCLFFSWPFFVPYTLPFIKFLGNRKSVTLLLISIFVLVIYLNTVVHPYLLADNRHYTFYIWNRFYGKYAWFKYLMIPVYYFGIYCILSQMYTKTNVVSLLFYIVCTSLVLILQKMIEVRYFFIPYVIFRFHFKNIQKWQICAEFLFYCVLNVCTYYIFFEKDIYWSNYENAQKLIW